MSRHIRISVCIADRHDAQRVEHSFTEMCTDCIVRFEPDPDHFLHLLATTAADVVILDSTAESIAIDRYLPLVQAELSGRPLLLLVSPDQEPRRLHCSGSGYVEVIPKSDRFAEELPRAVLRLMQAEPPETVPRNRAAEILSGRGDHVDQSISGLEDNINNPLMTIFGTVELLLQQTPELTDDTRKKLRIIQRSARRIQNTVRKLSTLAREE